MKKEWGRLQRLPLFYPMDNRWSNKLKAFRIYLQVDRSLSGHSIAAYLHDVGLFCSFLEDTGMNKAPEEVQLNDFREFLVGLEHLKNNSQARIVSGLRTFYRFLLTEGDIKEHPMNLLQAPKTHRHLPQVLTFEEVEAIENSFDLSQPENFRNKVMVEMMYSCGLRVSELVTLRLPDLLLDEGCIRVTGKGRKQRLVPIGHYASRLLQLYIKGSRATCPIQQGYEDFVFLNRRGQTLTREMVFTVVKKAAEAAGITKQVSPHSFRHAFATHLVEGGADLRSVQAMLGHKNITTTEIYTHLDRGFLEDTIRNFHPRYKYKSENQ